MVDTQPIDLNMMFSQRKNTLWRSIIVSTRILRGADKLCATRSVRYEKSNAKRTHFIPCASDCLWHERYSDISDFQPSQKRFAGQQNERIRSTGTQIWKTDTWTTTIRRFGGSHCFRFENRSSRKRCSSLRSVRIGQLIRTINNNIARSSRARNSIVF